MKTEHLTKAYESSNALLDELVQARQESQPDDAMLFYLLEKTLILNTKIYVILTAATQSNAAKTKGTT